VISVVLTTLGFTFPNKFGISAAYAKLAYTGWALQRFLVYKRLALCKFYKVDEEDMGRAEIFDRILNGLSIGLVALILFDWLSVRMGMAIKGVFAFGSLGTLAFTLGSQKLVAQVRTDMFDVTYITMLLLFVRRSVLDGHGSDNVYYRPCCCHLPLITGSSYPESWSVLVVNCTSVTVFPLVMGLPEKVSCVGSVVYVLLSENGSIVTRF
jgi:hypothetical protein